MKRVSQRILRQAGCGLIALGAAWAAGAADFELTGPDGRRILLRGDNTWRYVEDAGLERKNEAAGKDAGSAQTKPPGEAVLLLDGKIEGNRFCRLQLRLINNLPYEIRSLVPEFAVYRTPEVVYDSQFSGFSFLKPGDSQRREVRFNGIDCQDIVRVQVGGGDRCEMGELDKFAAAKGKCLALIRVEPSAVLKFDK